MTARMIDPSARIEAGATIGKDVLIGPYCTIGAHVRVSGTQYAATPPVAGQSASVPHARGSPAAPSATHREPAAHSVAGPAAAIGLHASPIARSPTRTHVNSPPLDTA